MDRGWDIASGAAGHQHGNRECGVEVPMRIGNEVGLDKTGVNEVGKSGRPA
jgi:hypothetical protein